MSVLTVEKIKVILQDIGFDKDALYDQLLMSYKNKVVDDLSNRFIVDNIFLEGTTVSFDSNIISDSDSGFVTAGFVDGMDISVFGSKSNDGIYLIDTVAAGTLTLTDGYSLTTEPADSNILIQAINFPAGMLFPFAQLIKHSIQNIDPAISSRRLGDYSETYNGDGGIPAGIKSMFNDWRKIKT